MSENEEGAAESSDEDNRDSNACYSSCAYTMGAITRGLNDGSTTRDRVGICGTSGASGAGMGYGYNMAWYRCVKIRL